MTSRSKLVLAAHRLFLRTARTPLARLWALAYRAFAWAAAAYLLRGERGAATYIRGSLGSEDYVPGLSDIDLAVVLAPDPAGPGVASARARARWERLRQALPATDLLIDHPRIYDEDELREVSGASTFTYGLDGRDEWIPRRSAYSGKGIGQDAVRALERPGLYGTSGDWQLVAGRDRRLVEPDRDPQRHRIAAWLELLYCWLWVFPVCVDPSGPRTSALCVKLVADPARIWLWLAHGERVRGRAEALESALRRMPEEERALRRALDLWHSLPDSPAPPLAELLPALVRLSVRIAALIESQLEEEGATTVRLLGADPPELVLTHGEWLSRAALGEPDPAPLPLCDWRSLVLPRMPDDAFALLPGDPSDPAALGAAAAAQERGPYPTFRADNLMVLPALTRWRARLRAIKCPASDPVSFALACRESVARFPDVCGWSAFDTARRALAEHQPWLRDPEVKAGHDGRGGGLGLVLAAARAALFMETLWEGEPRLALTVTETVRSLSELSSAHRAVAEEALEAYRGFAPPRTTPKASTVAALRNLVRDLPAYAEAERR